LVLGKLPPSEQAAFSALKNTNPVMYDITYKRIAKNAVDELYLKLGLVNDFNIA
jgi:hypothetical protein